MQNHVTYQSYSKERKPFLTTHYPFLTPNQINAKLRQEWMSLNSTKTKAKLNESRSFRCGGNKTASTSTTTQDQVTYESYSKHRKPFLATHYPFLKPNQINAKLRQEWTSLNFTKLNKTKGKTTESPNCSRSNSKSPSRRLTSNQKQASASSLASQRSFHDPTPEPPLAPLPWDQMFNNDDDRDEDVGSPYQRNKSRIDELNRSAFSNFSQQRRSQPHNLQSKYPTTEHDESEINKECQFLDKGDHLSEEINHFTRRKIKGYSGNVFKLDYPVPAIEFDEDEENNDIGGAGSSILKNCSSTSLNTLSDTMKSKVRFSHLTPDTHRQSKNEFIANSNRSSPRFSLMAKKEHFDEKEMLNSIRKINRTANSTVSSVNRSISNFDFDDSADATYAFCSYSTFKKTSNPYVSGTEINSQNKEKISTLVKSKSTSLLQNTISACSKIIKKSKSLRGRSSSRGKFVIENKTEGFSTPCQNQGSESKSWQRSPVKSRQLSTSLNTMSSYKSDFESEDDASLCHDDDDFNLVTNNNHNMEIDSPLRNRKTSLPSQTKQRPCTKGTSSPKRLTPSTIARQLRSMSKQLSATKLFSPKTKSYEKSKPSPTTAKGRSFSKSKSDSNMRDFISYDKVKERKNTSKQSRMEQPSSSASNVTRQLRSFSKQLSESWNSSETLKTPSYEKKVSFCMDRFDSQLKDSLNYSDIYQGIGTKSHPDQEMKVSLHRGRKNVTPSYKTRHLKTNSSVHTNQVSNQCTTMPLLTIPSVWHSKGITFPSDHSDTEDRESFYSDDENAALLVRRDGNQVSMLDKDDCFKEDATDYCKTKDHNFNNNLLSSRKSRVVHNTSDTHERCERRYQTVSNGDHKFLTNKQNHNLNYSQALGRSKHCNNEDEENHLVREPKQTKSVPTPALHNSKRKLKESKMKMDVKKSNSNSSNSDKLFSRFDNSHKSFQWNDDDQDSFIGVNYQRDEYSNDHKKDVQEYTMNKMQHSEGRKLNESKNHFQKKLSEDFQSNKNTCRKAEIEKYSKNNTQDVQSHSSCLIYPMNEEKGESFYSDDDDYSDEEEAKSELPDNNDNDSNETVLMGHYEDEEEDDDDDDDNAFASKMACQTHAVLSGALRRIQSMQSVASDFGTTICSVTDDMVSSCSDKDLEDDADMNNINDDDDDLSRPSHSYNRSSQQCRGDFTLTDLFDDLPDNRPRVDSLGMARRMFQSSTVETCSNFGSLFDEDDIFI